MVVVVQLFAGDEDADGRNVAACVFDVVVAVAECVSDAVDDSGGPEGDPDHLHGPYERSDEEAKEPEVDGEHEDNAE